MKFLHASTALSFLLPLFCGITIPVAAHAEELSHLWSQGFGDSETQSVKSITTDPSGNVLVTGDFYGTMDFGGGPLTSVGYHDIFLVKFDPSGDHIWSKRFGDSDPQYSRSITTDPSGNVWVTGFFAGTVDFGGGPLICTSAKEIFLVKFDPNGNHIWSQRFGEFNGQYAMSIATDPSGNVFVTGDFFETVDFGGGPLTSAGGVDLFLVKFDSSGNHIWSQRYGTSGRETGVCLTTDLSGNVLVTGLFNSAVDFGGGLLSSAGNFDIFLVKFGPSGNHNWSQRFGDSGLQLGSSITTDHSGNVFVTGVFEGTVDFGGGPLQSGGIYDIFVAKFTPGGNHNWSQHFGDSDEQYVNSISTDPSGNILLTGGFLGTVDFGGGQLTNINGLDLDMYLVKFGPSGGHIWSKSYGDIGDQSGQDVTTDLSGNVVVAGGFFGTVDFGGGPLTSAGDYDTFVVKYSSDPTAVPEVPQTFPHLLGAYPNPFNPNTSVIFTVDQAQEVRIDIFDVMGWSIAVIADQLFEPGEHFVGWDGRNSAGHLASSGTYFVRMKYADGGQSKKIMLVK